MIIYIYTPLQKPLISQIQESMGISAHVNIYFLDYLILWTNFGKKANREVCCASSKINTVLLRGGKKVPKYMLERNILVY